MIYFLEEMLIPFVVGAVFILVAVGPIALAVEYGIIRPTCLAHWRNSGYEVRWSLWGDCQISQDGKTWMNDDAYVALHKQVVVSK